MARRLVITENITLDGVVDNDGSWFDPTDDSPQGRELAAVTHEHALRDLELLESRSFAGGVVLLRYARPASGRRG